MRRDLRLTIGLGTPRFGAWCDACLKPSGVEVDVLNMNLDGVSVLCTHRRCVDCGCRLKRGHQEVGR